MNQEAKAMCPSCGSVEPEQRGERYVFTRRPIWWPVGRCPKCEGIVWSRDPSAFGLSIEYTPKGGRVVV